MSANQSLLTTASTGYDMSTEQYVVDSSEQKHALRKWPKESIKDTIQTGFGADNQLHNNCPKQNLITYISKENYLSEFESPTEKKLARNNLDVYSKEETLNLIKGISSDNAENFVTKQELIKTIDQLEYVDSSDPYTVDYQIPSHLFKK